MGKPLIIEGYLRLWEQEGGFADDSIILVGPNNVPDVSLSELIRLHWPECISEYKSAFDVGNVRITVERIGGKSDD